MSPLVAIDGPAGSGKSTIARLVAERLGLERLDTGAMYRAVTLLALRAGIDLTDEAAAGELARAMSLSVGERVMANSDDVTDAIRSPEVDAAVSCVAAHPAVRTELVRRQREWAAAHAGGVVEGRDIGSVVFPGADLKIYLTADVAERARRRAAERPADHATDGGAAELDRRDQLDSNRQVSPLQVPDGAIVVDSTGLSIDEVVREVLSHL